MKGTGKAPYTAKVLEDRFVVTMYNISSSALPKAASFTSDKLISKMTVAANGKNSVILTFYLKNKNIFYGFDVDYTTAGFLLKLKQPKLAASGSTPLKGFTVVIDAGHGGKALGAFGPMGRTGMVEVDITMAVTMKLKKDLEKLGAKVFLTRIDDTYSELSDRVNAIKIAQPDISVSLHCNSMPNSAEPSKHYGMFGFYTYGFSKVASDAIINKAGPAFGIEARGSRTDVFALTRQWRYPSVLIEMMFMTNPKEYEMITDSRKQDAMASGIASGIVDFFRSQK
jgi:N-acetylmuramoyl-L-alanine amidase